MITFRTFTQSDWESLAGCTSEQPQIAELEYNGNWQYVVVVDGCRVEVISLSEDSSNVYGNEFPSETHARAVAEAIVYAYEAMKPDVGGCLGTHWIRLIKAALPHQSVM